MGECETILGCFVILNKLERRKEKIEKRITRTVRIIDDEDDLFMLILSATNWNEIDNKWKKILKKPKSKSAQTLLEARKNEYENNFQRYLQKETLENGLILITSMEDHRDILPKKLFQLHEDIEAKENIFFETHQNIMCEEIHNIECKMNEIQQKLNKLQNDSTY